MSSKAPADESETDKTGSAVDRYLLAHDDSEFLQRDEVRHIRLQLELLRPDILLEEQHIESTIVLFGSARIPDPATAGVELRKLEAKLATDPENLQLQNETQVAKRRVEHSRYHDYAKAFARLASLAGQQDHKRHYVIVTGGGPGIMEAGNQGAIEAGGRSVGFNISLPREQEPNAYISPGLCFQFHYFALRKMHFLMRARALAIFPGGYGTLDELLDALTLIQTGKIDPIPVLMFGESYWRKILNFEALVEEGMISPADAELVQFVESPEQAWSIIEDWYRDKN